MSELSLSDINRISANLLACVKNQERLAKLTAHELIRETLASDAADYDVVIELMNRVLPGWSEMPDGEFE